MSENAKKIEEQLQGIEKNLSASVEKVKTDLETSIKKINEAVEKSGDPAKIKEIVAGEVKSINESIREINEWKQSRGPIDSANQEAIDKMLGELKQITRNTSEKEGNTFGEVFAREIAKPDIAKQIAAVTKGKSFTLELKGVTDMSLKAPGTMTGSASVTGDVWATYSSRQSFAPMQRTNFRDLIPTVYSDTGLYVHYNESGGEGSVGEQTEGSAKDQLDFDFTEVKTVNSYVSGFTRFSKQIAKNLPFLQSSLPRLLLRKFYNKENNLFMSAVAAAATATQVYTETDDVKRLIDNIAVQNDADYNVDFVLINHRQSAALNKLLYTNGYYQGSGGVLSNVDGSIRIGGVPVLPVSWMNSDKALLVDRDFLERVEVEGLRVEFFEQDSDNVQKNLITARIECYEEINPMRGAAFMYLQL